MSAGTAADATVRIRSYRVVDLRTGEREWRSALYHGDRIVAERHRGMWAALRGKLWVPYRG